MLVLWLCSSLYLLILCLYPNSVWKECQAKLPPSLQYIVSSRCKILILCFDRLKKWLCVVGRCDGEVWEGPLATWSSTGGCMSDWPLLLNTLLLGFDAYETFDLCWIEQTWSPTGDLSVSLYTSTRASWVHTYHSGEHQFWQFNFDETGTSNVTT